MNLPVHSLNNPDWKRSHPLGALRAFAGVLLCLILLSTGFCGAAAAVSSDGVLAHTHSADYALSVTDDADYCSLCDLAAKVNALPAADDITVDNALDVELALIAIDQLKYKVFSINDEEYYEIWLSLLNEVETPIYGQPIPSQYFNASDAVLETKGSLVKVVIVKKYMPVDGEAVDAEDATVTFSLVNEHGSTQLFTLSTADTLNSYSANLYSEVLEGSTVTGWSYVLYLKPGEYTLTEVSDSGAVLADGTPFVTGSTTYAVDDGAATSGDGVRFVAEEGEITRVLVQNTYTPRLTIQLNAPMTMGGAEFTVTISSAIDGTYSGIEFTNGVGIVEISPGSSKIIENLPMGIEYEVLCPDIVGYQITSCEAYDGTLSSDSTATFVYVATEYNVTFDANGGSGSMAEQEFTYDESQQLSENNFTRTGYTFAGWSTEENGVAVYTDKESVMNLSVSSPVTLYANWTANSYNVTFDANGGSGSMAEQEFTYDKSQQLTANNFTRVNHAFTEWNTEADGSGSSYNDKAIVQNLTAVDDGTVTLYAQWESTIIVSPGTIFIPSSTPSTPVPVEPEQTETVTITFNANDGSGQVITQTEEAGKELILDTNTFTREGYLFNGWAEEPAGTILYLDEEVITLEGSITLYAVWEEIPVVNTESGLPVGLIALGVGIIIVLIIAGVFIARRK